MLPSTLSFAPPTAGRARWCAPLAVIVIAMAISGHATAATTLVVRRSLQASDCPDAPALSRSIRSMTPKAPAPAVDAVDADTIEVAFERSAESYRVHIRMAGSALGFASSPTRTPTARRLPRRQP